MKKIFSLIIFFAFFLLANQANARWYGYTGIGYSYGSTTSCPTDGDTSGGSNPTYGEAAVTTAGGTSPVGSKVAVGSSGTMYCLKWDGSAPAALSVSYNTITTNASQTISYSSNDWGGSRLKRVILFQSQNGGGWTAVKDNDNLALGNGVAFSSSYTKTPVSGSSFKYKVGAYDYAGNYSEVASSNVIFFDTIIPSGLTIDYHNGWTNSQKVVTVTAKDTGGSKLKRILLQQSQNGGGWTTAADWDNLNWADNTITTRTFTRAFINRTDFKYRIFVYDYAGNSSTYTSSNVLRYENEIPSGLTINYDNGWTNVNKNITVTLKDTGGSKLKRILLQQSQNGGSWTTAADWDNLNWADNTTITRTFTRTLVNGSNFKYRYYAYDYAGNSSSLASGNEIKFDNRIPDFSDINFPIAQDLQAGSYSYRLIVRTNGAGMYNGGAPITLINARSENYTNKSTYSNRSSTNSTLAFSWEVRTVDGVSDKGTTYGGREYSLIIDRICDEAGNCKSAVGTRNHYVYANTDNIATKEVYINELTSDNNIADGTEKKLVIKLLDIYGNQVIPASGISRKINMKFNGVTNTMYLDQYNRSGTKSVDATNANSPAYSSTLFESGDVELDNEYSSNGDYVYKFRFYTPTANSYSSSYTVSDPDAEFKIGSITFGVTGSLGARSNELVSSSNITAKAKSLYNTSITGQIDENGLRAQTNQNGNIRLVKESSSKTPSSGSVKFKFTDNLGIYTLMYGGGIQVSESDTLTTYENINTLTNKYISTYLQLDSAPAPSTTDGYFSTHISYILDGKNILINSDVIGRDSYHGATKTVNLVQSGLKVVGNIYDKDSQEVFENQEVTSLGTIEKIDIKSDVIAQAYNFAKEVTYNSIADGTRVNGIFGTSGGGKRVGDVIYFGNVDDNGPNKIYELGSGTEINVNDTKTILVIGGNLYIRSNMYYSPNKNLGIVVLKDKAGNGGNVYIDPNVTNIVGTIFAEKALISYNGAELDGNVDASTLKNQLHIYGSVFSYNTIGGSSKTPLICPYFETSCDLQKSFKYDLNYLRRYFLTRDGTTNHLKPAYGAKVSGGGTYSPTGNGIITGNNVNYARIINNTTTDDYAKYSVIIEYNPTLKSVIPPFFNQR